MKKIIETIKKIKLLPRRFYILGDDITYVDITRSLTRVLIMIFVFSFFIGYFYGRLKSYEKIIEVPVHISDLYKYDFNIGDRNWIDSVFYVYEIRAKIYLNKERYRNTPITPEMLSTAAYNTYINTGIIVPLELALAQALLESSMGRKGRSPKSNPWNIGEWDDRTVSFFETTYEGTVAYYDLMANMYLKCRTVEELFTNFVNCNGNRYASDPKYEVKVRHLYYNIKYWIDSNFHMYYSLSK